MGRGSRAHCPRPEVAQPIGAWWALFPAWYPGPASGSGLGEAVSNTDTTGHVDLLRHPCFLLLSVFALVVILGFYLNPISKHPRVIGVVSVKFFWLHLGSE